MPLTTAQLTALRTLQGNSAHYSFDGTDSTVGEQLVLQKWIKDAMIEVAPTMWFSQSADTVNMPKHMGKRLVRYLYLPLLDDRNVNDQGIDATGVTIANGNLWGSSTDINQIMEFMPMLSEYGGRVNRVSYTRIKLEGSFEEFGFFSEYTLDTMQFDTDAELKQHNVREAFRGMSKIFETRLQIDLIVNAGTVIFGGIATARDEITGASDGEISIMSYDGFVTLGLRLDELDVPMDTPIHKGSTLIDTLTINGGRLLYVGTHHMRDLLQLTDYHGSKAFLEAKHYATATQAHGEEGAIDTFRIIKVKKDMLHYNAGGAIADPATNAGYLTGVNEAGEVRYNVYPMILVGAGSYTTISFKNSKGGKAKFEYFDQAPKQKIRERADPYGKTGFIVLSGYYGFMGLRTERLVRIETVGRG